MLSRVRSMNDTVRVRVPATCGAKEVYTELKRNQKRVFVPVKELEKEARVLGENEKKDAGVRVATVSA